MNFTKSNNISSALFKKVSENIKVFPVGDLSRAKYTKNNTMRERLIAVISNIMISTIILLSVIPAKAGIQNQGLDI
jgi:hypothetical protein